MSIENFKNIEEDGQLVIEGFKDTPENKEVGVLEYMSNSEAKSFLDSLRGKYPDARVNIIYKGNDVFQLVGGKDIKTEELEEFFSSNNVPEEEPVDYSDWLRQH